LARGCSKIKENGLADKKIGSPRSHSAPFLPGSACLDRAGETSWNGGLAYFSGSVSEGKPAK